MSLLEFETGLAELLKEAKPEDIAIIRMYSVTNLSAICRLTTLLSERVPVPQERIFNYTPASLLFHREELLPRLENPNLHYVVIDNIVYTGTTLESATNALKRSGVAPENVWYLGYFRNSADGIALDRARKIIVYASTRAISA